MIALAPHGTGVETRDFKDVSVANIDAQIRQRLTWQGTKVDLTSWTL